MIKYKRILLKLSGEALTGKNGYGIDPEILNIFAEQIKEISLLGVEVAIVIGGGNIFRGLSGVGKGFDRVKGDSMGMLATVINSIALQSSIESLGSIAHVLTSINMEPFAEFYSKQKADLFLKKSEIVIIAGGTGNPYFTTDTASALRSVEINADILLKGTRVDGVYTENPEKNKSAIKFDTISFKEAYEKELNIMDLTAFTFCMENNMPVLVFNMNQAGNLKKIILGEKTGTFVHN
jgi:uridylate kinase